MQRKRILLIDDEADIRRVAGLALERIGNFEVAGAGSGGDGIAAAVADPPDAILLDVMMPGLDGPSVLASLRTFEATRDIPVIFLTAKVQRAELHHLASLGACGTIAKPFDPATLAADVCAILSRAAGEAKQ